MKNYFPIIIVAMILIVVLNSCRQEDSITESVIEEVMQNDRNNDEASKNDTIDNNITPADPPVKDGQQWKQKK
ncbi:hypothetical protein [Chryseobacterium defluvii]|uniref:Uncharacterized protein n=1 Tax=Chryseobacterium defluvii TaxID=160396 RepID=A0A495SBG8_9FLAO|nr:hypothetical protein [Chryseobacterium defluvii]RKS96871.1 hypothetical protein BCF58_3306 [Chryseobacterium defluvii]